jgi:phage terminase large subunit-like protein
VGGLAHPARALADLHPHRGVRLARARHAYRRYRTVYIEVPRKNAKSTLSSAVALYMLTADREPGAEIYSAATTRDQARIIFNDAKQMAQRTPELRIRFGVRCYVHSVSSQFREQRESELAEYAGLFIPLSAEGSTLDGLNVHFATVDELHAHKKRAVWDVIETATGSRTQSLLWAITTAGVDTSGICYEQRSYVTRLLNAVLRRHDGLGYPIKGTFADDETYFGIVYTIDDGDDWSDPTCWSKANPNLGISVYPDDIRRLADKALRMASARSNFLTKRLNVWVNAAQAWMDMRKWDACADPELAIEQFLEDDAIIALDLASKRDIADKLTLFDRLVDGKKHYYAFARHYLPDEACSDDVNPQYVGWKTDGWLTTTPGNVTDYDAIERDLEADIARLKVREVPFDPWQATQLSTHMLEKGAPMIELRQTVQNLSEAMKEFEAVVIDGRFHHRGDPVLTWMVGNVIARRDAKDNIYPRKEHEDKKIDGAVACIMAIARAMVKAPPQASVYEELAKERAAAAEAAKAEEASMHEPAGAGCVNPLRWLRRDPLEARAAGLHLGQRQAGVNVTEDTAQTFSAVAACVRIISETLASLPWCVYRKLDGGREELPGNPIAWLLGYQPNPEQTAMVFRRQLLAHYLLWGNGYAEIERGMDGRAVWLWPLLPDRSEIKRSETGALVCEVRDARGQAYVLPRENVYHLSDGSYDGLMGCRACSWRAARSAPASRRTCSPRATTRTAPRSAA